VIALAASLAALLGAAGNADAQWRGGGSRVIVAPAQRPPVVVVPPPRVVVPQLVINGFSPQTAAPGSRITIHGSGFTPDTMVFVGNHAVPVESVRPTSLTFLAPSWLADGRLVVSHPGLGDRMIGTLSIARAPIVTQVAMESQWDGTRILIRGSFFQPGDQVLLGGMQLSIAQLASDRIVALLPYGAASGPLTVVRYAAGQRLASAAVQFHAPVHGGWDRDDGWDRDRGRRARGRWARWGRGRDRGYEQAPALARITSVTTHAFGHETRLRIVGDGFAPDARVRVGGVECAVISRGPAHLVVSLPAGLSGQLPLEIFDGRGYPIGSYGPVAYPAY
jgi:hypothetical protein